MLLATMGTVLVDINDMSDNFLGKILTDIRDGLKVKSIVYLDNFSKVYNSSEEKNIRQQEVDESEFQGVRRKIFNII